MERLRRAVSLSLVINLCLLLVAPAVGQTPQSPPYLDPSLPVERRVGDLVRRGALYGRGRADGVEAMTDAV